MKIIPVVDIKQGRVVHAIKGQRDKYHAIKSKLCKSCNPVEIITAILNLYPFPIIYIADLDAITGVGDNIEIITTILDNNPHLTLWLDSGVSKHEQIKNKQFPRIIDVIGTETGISKGELIDFNKNVQESVLSLDFAEYQFLGDKLILQTTDIWQKNIIVMALNRVGSNNGPDVGLANSIKSQAFGRNVYIAGGISNISQIESLQEIEIDGVLIATALHSGNLTGEQIELVARG